MLRIEIIKVLQEALGSSGGLTYCTWSFLLGPNGAGKRRQLILFVICLRLIVGDRNQQPTRL